MDAGWQNELYFGDNLDILREQIADERGRRAGGSSFVKGLKQLFGNQVALFSLDPESSRQRGIQTDHEVYIAYDQIVVEDVIALQDELQLNPTATKSAYLVYAMYKNRWLRQLLSADSSDVKQFAEDIGANKSWRLSSSSPKEIQFV